MLFTDKSNAQHSRGIGWDLREPSWSGPIEFRGNQNQRWKSIRILPQRMADAAHGTCKKSSSLLYVVYDGNCSVRSTYRVFILTNWMRIKRVTQIHCAKEGEAKKSVKIVCVVCVVLTTPSIQLYLHNNRNNVTIFMSNNHSNDNCTRGHAAKTTTKMFSYVYKSMMSCMIENAGSSFIIVIIIGLGVLNIRISTHASPTMPDSYRSSECNVVEYTESKKKFTARGRTVERCLKIWKKSTINYR